MKKTKPSPVIYINLTKVKIMLQSNRSLTFSMLFFTSTMTLASTNSDLDKVTVKQLLKDEISALQNSIEDDSKRQAKQFLAKVSAAQQAQKLKQLAQPVRTLPAISEE